VTLAVIVALPAGLDPVGWSAPIAGDSALCRAVAAVRASGPVVVAAAEVHAQPAWEMLAAKGFGDVTVLPVPGSADERQCLSAALAYVARPPLCAAAVLVHDVRYPLAPAGLAARVVAALSDAEVVLPTVAMTDSVKVLAAHGVVGGNADRAELTTVQYPRGYTTTALARCLDGEDLTSAAVTVEGDPTGFAVDLVRDGALVEAILTAG
jgi:2-C-methyl-D-erythritol 4-phosphate cytidylyltransferase